MKRKREHTPMDHQRANVRQELHAIVDRLVDDWQWIDSLSGSVRSATGGEGTSKGSHADPTASSAFDPAGAWLDSFRDLRVRLRLLDAARAKLSPASPKRGRENTVDVCVRCQTPNPKMHRIDGYPYCATTCYYQEWRSRRAG